MPNPNIEVRQVFLLDRILIWTIASVKYFYLTDSCYPTCKNVQYPSYTKKHTIILYYYWMFRCGVYLHFQKRQSLPQGGDVFNSHANFKIVSSFHTIHQITPKLLRYSLRRNPRNSSKNKFSDNLKSPIITPPIPQNPRKSSLYRTRHKITIIIRKSHPHIIPNLTFQ